MRRQYVKATKAAAFLLAAAMAVSATGCGRGDADRTQDGSAVQGADRGGTDAEMPSEATDSATAPPAAANGDAGTAGGSAASTGSGEDREKDGGENSAKNDGAVEAEAVCAITDFGLRLLQLGMEEAAAAASGKEAFQPESARDESLSDGNVLLSPLSVLQALTMTAGGARGETLRQMEEAFGISVPELSSYLADYQRALPAGDEYKLSMANGIWFTADESFTVETDFLERSGEMFDCTVCRADFDDSTRQEINAWVKNNTDGMIEEILDEIPEDAVMYLVNALAFDARWQERYREDQVREREFTMADGTAQKVQMMYSEESLYLEDEHAQGLMKYYADGKYAFAALLPEEGMTLAEYAATLTGARLLEILWNPVSVQVSAAIPRFRSEYGADIRDMLREMGMADAFDMARADFSGIGSSSQGNLYISRVLHKTYMAVDENGTRAGAATAVEMRAEGAMEDVKVVHLDRPFLYMIIDCRERLPIFMGTVEAVTAP